MSSNNGIFSRAYLSRFLNVQVLGVVIIQQTEQTWQLKEVHAEPLISQLYFWETVTQVNDIISTTAMAITMKCSEDNHGKLTIVDVQHPFSFRCYCISYDPLTEQNNLSQRPNMEKTLLAESIIQTRLKEKKGEDIEKSELVQPSPPASSSRFSNRIFLTCLCHRDYPASAAFALLNDVRTKSTSRINTINTYHHSGIDEMYMKKIQDPAEIDKLQKVQENLDDLKLIIVSNLQKLTVRGEHLDELIRRSENLHDMSTQFVQSAKRVHKCCWIF